MPLACARSVHLVYYDPSGLGVDNSFWKPIFPWGANGNWPAGTFPLDQYGVGSEGAIAVGVIPEPTSAGLMGLGLCALAIVRRRRQ